jgi:peptidoglycan/xylan/chitin deacetylase (PgdA/CDA1 family)
MQEPVVLWDLDTEDWSSRNAQKVTEKVLGTIKDGDIVLMHDIYDSTAEAVEILVPKLKEQGYQIVSVSELARYKGKTLELNKAYGEIEGSEE